MKTASAYILYTPLDISLLMLEVGEIRRKIKAMLRVNLIPTELCSRLYFDLV